MANKLIIYSIPKCGTHFLSKIVALLLDPNCNIYNKNELYRHVVHYRKAHFNEMSEINSPFFNTHPGYLSYDKTDIKKCSEYESEHRSFNVGAIQNGLFFRQGGNKNYENICRLNKLKD